MESTASQPSSIILIRPAYSESSRAMRFAGLLQASSAHSGQETTDRRQGGGISDGSFSSSFDSLGGGGGGKDMGCDDDDEDDSLQDTACSSAARFKVTRINGMCVKSMVTVDAKEMANPQLATGAVREVIGGGNNNEKQLHECNDLRKRGLCLVPLSMLIDYLG